MPPLYVVNKQNDWNNTQKIDHDFFSAIMRLDVDKNPGSLPPNPHGSALPSLTNYSIPPDNPYVGATSFNGAALNPTAVRTEFWAVGMRNSWRFSFDSATNILYLGHVGQETLEWINIVTNGANCGWNFYEGNKQWTNPLPSGFLLNPPLIQYGHTNSRTCVIGGIVYRGSRIAPLYGDADLLRACLDESPFAGHQLGLRLHQPVRLGRKLRFYQSGSAGLSSALLQAPRAVACSFLSPIVNECE
ncbi:MAG: hypothetical protein QOJ40_2410 [Verrucomicrobiota bacterium]